MDSFKLAQVVFEPPWKGFQSKALKDIDVSACISDELQAPQSGYNCLHLSVLEGNLKLTEHFLKQGADPLKQGTNNGRTPLLAFILERPYHCNKRINELSGKLEKNQMVDLLLSEQVKKNRALNPKCSSGISHLHIACMVDHCAAVELFLKAGEFVNQATLDDGSTPLHLAARYSSTDSAKALISYGADIHLKDSSGRSPLHTLVSRLIDTRNNCTIGRLPFTASVNQELKRLEMMAYLVLNTRKNSEVNFVDDLGLSALHVACTHREPFMALDLLKGDVDVDEPVANGPWAGWTALHFAACCSVDTVKSLLERGADIAVKNADGHTPLDLCTRRYSPKTIRSILASKPAFREIALSDGTTRLLELIRAMDGCEELGAFLKGDAHVPADSPIWPGSGVLHLAVSMREEEEASYWRRIVVCLARRCSLTARNAEGRTPVHLAFEIGVEVADKLLNCATSNEVDGDGLSFLHLACALGMPSVVERFLADKNAPARRMFQWRGRRVRANSTPLHVAVEFERREVVEHLLKSGADAYARDESGFTPLHLSSGAITHLFLGGVSNLKEVTSRDGLSHLHVAAAADDDRAIETLLRNGANVNATFRPSDEVEGSLADYAELTPLHVAAKRRSLKAAAALIQAGADLHAASRLETPLQEALKCDELTRLVAKKLRRDKRARGPIESCGVTLLHIACASFDLRWAQKLLDRKAEVDAKVRDDDAAGEWRGYAPMHALLASAARVGARRVKNLADVVGLLLRHGADATLRDGEGYSPVLMAERFAAEEERRECEEDEAGKKRKEEKDEGAADMYSIADLLLKSQKSYSANPATREGSTHFHYACKRNMLEIARKFIAKGADVSHAKRRVWAADGGFTPLHFALAHDSLEVAWLLLEHGADVTAANLRGETPLHVAVKNNVDDVLLLQGMWSIGADVKAQTFYGATPLDLLLRSDHISSDELKFFLDHGCSIELEGESNVLGLLLHNANPSDRQDVFRLLFERCSLTERIEAGFAAIHSLVAFAPVPKHRRWTVDMYLGTIRLFVDMGCELDRQTRHESTALHEAVTHLNIPAIEALLLLGADVNVVDSCGQTAFTYDLLGLDDDRTPEWRGVIAVLACHAWKMKFVGMRMHGFTELLAKFFWGKGYLQLGMEQRCEDELKRAGRTRLWETRTLRDFLTKPRALIEYQTIKDEERRRVDEVFQAHAEMRREFPEFCGLLTRQYRKAREYVELYSPMRNAIASLLKLEVPDECFYPLLHCLGRTLQRNILEASKRDAEED